MQVAILAAGFTPGEADQLRRAMAAWKRKGGLEKYYDRIVNGMLRARLRPGVRGSHLRADQGLRRIRLSGEPCGQLRAAGLREQLAEVPRAGGVSRARCSTSQPMGFYSPSQLVQDAKRHGVEVLPVDVTISGWDSVLERREGQTAAAVRLGLSLAAEGCATARPSASRSARAVRPFLNVSDLARRAQLDRHDLQVLAGANALASLAGNRREALWQSVAAVPDKDMLADARL